MKPGNELLFVALGGSGEIGMNVNLYGAQGKWLMVDLGMTFANSDYPGIDLVLPDLEFIENQADNLLGIVITHGHEDHIGAIPYLAADLGVPIYATRFAAGLIREKLNEEGIAGEGKLKVIDPADPFELGPFKLRYVPLAHSIPEGNALLIETAHGCVFHSGDWKLDDAPQLGEPSSAEALRAIGDEGVLAMICDSTNVFNEQASGSEATVREGLDKVVGEATGRVLVTTFASNAARLRTLGLVAQDTGRRLCVAGRSLDRILRVARAAGYLQDFPETVDWDTAMRLPPRDVLIVATGGQGEPRAALARVAAGSHPLKLEAGDTVVFSSRQIPGNEGAVAGIMNQLAEKGIHTITDRQAHVHVSGHPGRPELAQMYEWIRPQVLIPVHGEPRHLNEHARFALSNGVPGAIMQKNGDLIRLAPGEPKKVDEVRVGQLVLDGDIILPADGGTINERRRLGNSGLISVAVPVGRDGKLAGAPLVRPFGVPVEEDREDFIADATDAVAHAYKPGGDPDKTREAVRLAVRRCATLWTGKKPLVDVTLLQVGR